MKDRIYKWFEKNSDDSFSCKTIDIKSYDRFEGELETIVADINLLPQIGDILSTLGYVPDTTYFYEGCRDVITVPEKHINEKGEGNFTFQAYFHNFPDSVLSINNNALAVIVIQPKNLNNNGQREYNVVSYIHVNRIDLYHNNKRYDGYYYNMLRVSEKVKDGVKIYRRKKIFTLMFSIMHSIVDVDKNIAFAYGAMGKENQAINEALELNTKLYDKHYETWPFYNNTQFNKIFGKKSAFTKCIDISNDRERLREFYYKLKAQKEQFTFFHINTEEDFFKMLDKIFAYSKTSKVYMIPDENGNIDAACLAINWGEYFALQLQNPKGLFKLVHKMHITDKILYPIMIVGNAGSVRTLLKGIASHYNKAYGCKLTVLNSYDGDPYFKTKKSVLKDDYLFLMICNDTEILNAMKEKSKGEDGHVKLFIDIPLL